MSNSYSITGAALTPSTPTSADVCVVSGYVVDIQNQPMKGLVLQIMNLYYPMAVGTDTLVLRERLEVQTDTNGFFEFEALQGARLGMQVPNLLGDVVFEGNVPAAAQCDYLDIFLPYVVSIAWDDASISADVGESFQATLTGTLSDGTTCDVTTAVTTSVTNEAIVSNGGSGSYSGLAAGSTTITADSFDETILGIGVAVDDTSIKRFSVPATTLPAALAVTIS